MTSRDMTYVSPSQKAINAVIAVLMLGCLYAYFTSDFVVAPGYFSLSIYISVGMTALFILALFSLYLKGKWTPSAPKNNNPLSKKIVLAICAPFILYTVCWVNVASAFPQVFTLLLGEDITVNDLVTKDYSAGRYSCDYQLKPKSLDGWLFEYCISYQDYKKLPDNELKAELFVRQSGLGSIVYHIKVLAAES